MRQLKVDTLVPSTAGRSMARHLFLVSRRDVRLYEYLVERFQDDRNVEVVFDRRVGRRRRRAGPYSGPERRQSERRIRLEIDAELRVRSHVILTLPDNDTLLRD